MAKPKAKPQGFVSVIRFLPGRLIPLMRPHQLLTHYLSASYGYYILNESVMEDTDFDALCKRLLKEFDTFEHPHKHLTNPARLEEGTGYHLRDEDYPAIIRHGFTGYVMMLNQGIFEHAIDQQVK